jgi:hypothetical protein
MIDNEARSSLRMYAGTQRGASETSPAGHAWSHLAGITIAASQSSDASDSFELCHFMVTKYHSMETTEQAGWPRFVAEDALPMTMCLSETVFKLYIMWVRFSVRDHRMHTGHLASVNWLQVKA